MYEIAKLCQYNSSAEAKAIEDYTKMIMEVEKSELDAEDKKDIVEIVKELIADELNHQKKLDELYVALTDIQPNKE